MDFTKSRIDLGHYPTSPPTPPPTPNGDETIDLYDRTAEEWHNSHDLPGTKGSKRAPKSRYRPKTKSGPVPKLESE